jgi:Fic family protein
MGTLDIDQAATHYPMDNSPRGGIILIDPPTSERAKTREARWRIAPEIVGMIEKIAKARFEISKLTIDDLDKWENFEKTTNSLSFIDSTQIIEPLAQTVYASTKIEGEGIHFTDVPIAITGQANPEDIDQSPDYQDRLKGIRNIYGTYLWALAHPFPLEGGCAITTKFIMNLHRKMFIDTKPTIAGELKSKKNFITYNGKTVVEPLPPKRVPEFLEAICNRLTNSFRTADTQGRYSKLLAIAEFIVDFLAIHPFVDGNGRTARLLSTFLLEKSGFHFARFYSLDTIILSRRKEYYDALMNSQRDWLTRNEDLSPWIKFYIEAVYSQMQNALEDLLRKKFS